MVANPVLSLALACMLCLGSNQTLTRNTTLQRMPSVLVLLLLLLLLLSLLRLLPLFRPAVGFPRLGGVCMYGELKRGDEFEGPRAPAKLSRYRI